MIYKRDRGGLEVNWKWIRIRLEVNQPILLPQNQRRIRMVRRGLQALELEMIKSRLEVDQKWS